MKLVEIKRGESKIVLSQNRYEVKISILGTGVSDYPVEREAFFEAIDLLNTIYKESINPTTVKVVETV